MRRIASRAGNQLKTKIISLTIHTLSWHLILTGWKPTKTELDTIRNNRLTNLLCSELWIFLPKRNKESITIWKWTHEYHVDNKTILTYIEFANNVLIWKRNEYDIYLTTLESRVLLEMNLKQLPTYLS